MLDKSNVWQVLGWCSTGNVPNTGVLLLWANGSLRVVWESLYRFLSWVKCGQWRVGKTEVVPPDFHHLWWRTHVTWWSYSFMVLYGLQNTSTYIFQRVLNTSLQDIGDIASIFIVLDTGAHWGFVMRVSGEGRIWIAISHIESLAISTIPHQSAGSLSLYVYLCNEGGGLDAWKEPLQL